MYLKSIILIFTSLLFLGCSSSTDNHFLGKWERVEGAQVDSFEIVKNGNVLLMVDRDGNKTSAKIGDDGTLQMSGPFGIVNFSYISETDTIAGIGKEYKRGK